MMTTVIKLGVAAALFLLLGKLTRSFGSSASGVCTFSDAGLDCHVDCSGTGNACPEADEGKKQ
jgi:hypothetical protein